MKKKGGIASFFVLFGITKYAVMLIMKDSLKIGIKYTLQFVVSPAKTVPALYPESPEFFAMPPVFATGYLVGFLEWACILAVNPHLDYPHEQTVGTHINVSHQAATPLGLTVTATVELISIDGRKLTFKVEATDGIDVISSGTHERFVINREKFDAKMLDKISKMRPLHEVMLTLKTFNPVIPA